MEYINSEKLKTIQFNLDNFFILTDFDKTLTTQKSPTGWGILSTTDLLPKEYIIERQKLYEYYRPIELDYTIDRKKKEKLMEEWVKKHITLLGNYHLTQEIIKEAIQQNPFIFREGAKEFLTFTYKNHIPVIIISAGIGNFIEEFLKLQKVNYPNIHVISNHITFEENQAIFSNQIIHSLNKKVAVIPDKIKKQIENRPYTLLLGDLIQDIQMINQEQIKNTISVAFLDTKIEQNIKYYKEVFDIVLTNGASFYKVKEIIKI